MHLPNRYHELLTSAAVYIFREAFVFFLDLLKACEFGLLFGKQHIINDYAIYSPVLDDFEVLAAAQEYVDKVIAVELGIVAATDEDERIYLYKRELLRHEVGHREYHDIT